MVYRLLGSFLLFVFQILYQHGFTALTFFMALILGVLLVCLGFFIYYAIRRRKAVSPSKMNVSNEHQLKGGRVKGQWF